MRTIIPALAVLAFAGASEAQSVAPANPTAQCLQQVSRAVNREFSPIELESVSYARTAYEAMWDQTLELTAKEAEVWTAVTRYLDVVKEGEVTGEFPPGSFEVERSRYAREALGNSDPLRMRRLDYGPCEWPEINPASLSQRILQYPR